MDTFAIFIWGVLIGMILMNYRMVQKTKNTHHLTWEDTCELYHYLLTGRDM